MVLETGCNRQTEQPKYGPVPQSIFNPGLAVVLWDSIKRKDRCLETKTGRPTCQGRNKAPQMRLDPKIKKIPKYQAVCITPPIVPISFPHPCSESFECFPLHSDLQNQAHPYLMPPTSHPPLLRATTQEGMDFDSQSLFYLSSLLMFELRLPDHCLLTQISSLISNCPVWLAHQNLPSFYEKVPPSSVLWTLL